MPAGRQGFVQILLHPQGTGERGQGTGDRGQGTGSTARSPPVILSPSPSLRTGSANLARRHDAPPLRSARSLAALGRPRSTPRPAPARLPGLFRYTRLVTGQPLALYVHIPFCTAKCTYCDFNSYAGQESLMGPYAAAVAREAALWAPQLAGRQAETVFFGGGTPSLLPLPEMRVIVSALRERFDIAPDAEVTLEANPGTVDAAHLRGLRDLGFNRISFGAETLHDGARRPLAPVLAAREVEDAYRWARDAGFENVNLDLIYGLQGQSLAGWQANLEAALALGPEHLSLYALTLEDGTPMTRDVARGRVEAPDPDMQAGMFEWSRDRLARAGYRHYEVSNWARPGRESRHNLVYWRNGDWLGLGARAPSPPPRRPFAPAAPPPPALAPGTGG